MMDNTFVTCKNKINSQTFLIFIIILIWINDRINDNPTNEATRTKKTLSVSLTNLLRSPRKKRRRSRKSQRREEERQVITKFRRGNPTMRGLLLLCGVVLIQLLAVQTDAQRSKSKWQTLTGECSHFLSSCIKDHFLDYLFNLFFFACLLGFSPRVIARGGFSGLFPDSSIDAYNFAMLTSVEDVVLWCDLQLTKDGAGICFPGLTMSNASNIEAAYPNRTNTYLVNGVSTQGWFTIDFSLKDLNKVNRKSS